METIGHIAIDRGVPIMETRGRPTSNEYVTLLISKVGDSFVSHKSRHTLYQIARNLGIKVSIRNAGGKRTWRVYKVADRIIPPPKRKSLISPNLDEYPPAYGREER